MSFNIKVKNIDASEGITASRDIKEIQKDGKGVKLTGNKIQTTTNNGTTWSDLSEEYNAGKKYIDSEIEKGEVFNDYTNNNASGDYSHAEGSYTEASGSKSHAEGQGSTASNFCSHAEGGGTEASGYCSHAEGCGTKALGQESHAGGYSTIAENSYETVIGKWNIKNPASGDKVNNNKIFVVGNGTNDTTRSDAFIVKDTGETTINGNEIVNGIITSSGAISCASLTTNKIGCGENIETPNAGEMGCGKNNLSINYHSDDFACDIKSVFTIGNGDSTSNKNNILTINAGSNYPAGSGAELVKAITNDIIIKCEKLPAMFESSDFSKAQQSGLILTFGENQRAIKLNVYGIFLCENFHYSQTTDWSPSIDNNKYVLWDEFFEGWR